MPEKNPIGPVGHQVRQNIERLRVQHGLTKKALSGWTRFAGRTVPPLAISRIEAGTRRVDADDLAVLATALGVTPTMLLEPPGRPLERGEGFRGTRLAVDLTAAIRDVVDPGQGTDVAARTRTARRLMAQLGLELDEIEDAGRADA